MVTNLEFIYKSVYEYFRCAYLTHIAVAIKRMDWFVIWQKIIMGKLIYGF